MSTSSAEVRAQLDHPVIDADGHVQEYLPAALPYLREAMGPTVFDRYQERTTAIGQIMGTGSPEWRLERRLPQSAWWATPAANTRDLATAVFPGLLVERMGELGVDYSVLFPTKAFGTAGIDDDEERAARRAADGVLADRLEDIGTDAFLDEWLAQPLFAGLPADGRGARSRDAAGLAWSLRLAGTGTQEPLWDRLGELAMPVLVVAGERDEKFRTLGARLVEGIGANAELAVVADAGHAAHLERPDGFLAAVRPWLDDH
jgi:pimeloyl-ACP methyl ester carboxylesterase